MAPPRRARVNQINVWRSWQTQNAESVLVNHNASRRLTELLLPRSIFDLDFEWDDIKAAENVHNHGVSFAQAARAFRDPFAVEWLDRREAYGEERIILLGMSGDQLLTVVYTEREDRVRIISARRATKYEQDDYYRQNAP